MPTTFDAVADGATTSAGRVACRRRGRTSHLVDLLAVAIQNSARICAQNMVGSGPSVRVSKRFLPLAMSCRADHGQIR
jgi:hypothetical protein